mgnify:CR=1 FL=1
MQARLLKRDLLFKAAEDRSVYCIFKDELAVRHRVADHIPRAVAGETIRLPRGTEALVGRSWLG